MERVIYRDDDPDVGFALVPDLKWDQKELENLYVLAIAMKRGVLSLRELRAEHLPMLRNILHAGKVSNTRSLTHQNLRFHIGLGSQRSLSYF